MRVLFYFLTLFGAASSMAIDYPEGAAKFIEGAIEGARLQTQAHSAWGFGSEVDWFVDQDIGDIKFLLEDGTVATAPVQIIGTYNLEDGTFLWAWDHPSINEELKMHSRLVRKYGTEMGVGEFTSRKVTVSEEEAWVFTAVAARLAETNGVYRGRNDGPWVYMTFGEIKLAKE